MGLTVIPVSSGQTKRQLKLMDDFKPRILSCTPSYLLYMAEEAKEMGLDPQKSSWQIGVLGAEPWSESMRLEIEQLWNILATDIYGLSEMNGPGVSFECIYKRGMHTWEDSYILEIVDPVTQEPLCEGKEGEVVFTTLRRKATPLLRYRTRDLAFVYKDGCPCRRTHRRISRITGRTDDMLIVNGVNMFPSQIEEVIMRIPEVGTNYQIQLEKDGALDRLVVKVEIYSKMFTSNVKELENLKEKIKEELRASIIIHPFVELHEPGSLPVFEGKAKRVIDLRTKI